MDIQEAKRRSELEPNIENYTRLINAYMRANKKSDAASAFVSLLNLMDVQIKEILKCIGSLDFKHIEEDVYRILMRTDRWTLGLLAEAVEKDAFLLCVNRKELLLFPSKFQEYMIHDGVMLEGMWLRSGLITRLLFFSGKRSARKAASNHYRGNFLYIDPHLTEADPEYIDYCSEYPESYLSDFDHTPYRVDNYKREKFTEKFGFTPKIAYVQCVDDLFYDADYESVDNYSQWMKWCYKIDKNKMKLKPILS